MGDAQVPPEDGDARATPARRQALRLSDAEDVAATRLDMFGDPSLKEALVGQPPSPGVAAVPLSAAQGPADPPPPEGAADDGAQPAPLDEAPSDAPPSVALPPPGVGQDPGAGVVPVVEAGEHAPDAVAQPASADPAETQPGTPSEQPPSGTEPPEAELAPAAFAPQASAEASPSLSAQDAAEEAAQEDRHRKEAAETAAPFGSPFMMPPGSSEYEDMSTGPINERPRFRDELIRPIASSPIVSDAALPDAGLPPAPELPQDPPFMESPAQLPEERLPEEQVYEVQIYEERIPEDPPGVPTFPEFSEVSPYPEEGPAYHEPSPMPAEPAPPPPLFDAAAKIAAEADATAEALDNLKRLLGPTMPHLQPLETAYRPDRSGERIVPPDPLADGLRLRMQAIEGMHGMQAEPPPFMGHEPAPLLPLPMPPPQRASGRGVYLLGFLTGLALSLMAGGVLYFFISMG